MTDDIPEIDLPRGVALAWGVAANPQRGPKRELSIERIVEAAVEIADADGLGAVSMSSVAASLGFTTMSLYRYVTAKDDLILLMQEYGTGLPPASISEAPTWRDGMRMWSRATLEAYAAHRWLIEIPITGAPNTPNNLAWMDAALAALEGTPLTPDERIGVLLLITGQTRWEATVANGSGTNLEAIEERRRADAHVFSTFVTAEAFPALHRAIVNGAMSEGEEEQFQFGIELILDGVQRHIDARDGGEVLERPAPWEAPASYPRDEAVKHARQARREAEGRLREAQKREKEAIKRAVEREKQGK